MAKLKTWMDVYTHLKSGKVPLSTSEYRNLTRRLVKIIFEEGQENSTDFTVAIKVLEKEMEDLSEGGQQYAGIQKGIKALQDVQKQIKDELLKRLADPPGMNQVQTRKKGKAPAKKKAAGKKTPAKKKAAGKKTPAKKTPAKEPQVPARDVPKETQRKRDSEPKIAPPPEKKAEKEPTPDQSIPSRRIV